MKRKLKETIARLLHFNTTPREIALGTAIGVFIAILPVYGLHTVMVVIAAILVRPANKIAILLGTNVSLPPTVPFITWAGYEIGRFILRDSFPPLRWADFKNITLKKIISLYPPLFVGSAVLGIICAVIFYFAVLYFAVKIKRKRENDNTGHNNPKVPAKG